MALLADLGGCPGEVPCSPFPGAPSPRSCPSAPCPLPCTPRLLQPRPLGMAVCYAGRLLPPPDSMGLLLGRPQLRRGRGAAPGFGCRLSVLPCSPVLFLPFRFLISLDRQDLQPEIGIRSGRQDPGSPSCQCPHPRTCELCDKGTPRPRLRALRWGLPWVDGGGGCWLLPQGSEKEGGGLRGSRSVVLGLQTEAGCGAGVAVAPGTWEKPRADFLLGPPGGWTEDTPSLPSGTQSCAAVGSSQRPQEARTGTGWVPGSTAVLLGPLLAEASGSPVCASPRFLSLRCIPGSFS